MDAMSTLSTTTTTTAFHSNAVTTATAASTAAMTTTTTATTSTSSNNTGQPSTPALGDPNRMSEMKGVALQAGRSGMDMNQNCAMVINNHHHHHNNNIHQAPAKGPQPVDKSRFANVKAKEETPRPRPDSAPSNGTGPTNSQEDVKKPTEEELLKMLEEANRMLEADVKSCPSLTAAHSTTPGHSRKGSGSSIVSSNSTNSHYSAQNSNEMDDSNGVSISESLWEIWGRIINDWDSVKKKPAFLKELVRKGIPHEFRGMAWQLILGVADCQWQQEYAEHMKKTSPCEKLIRRDIARTFPDHDFFKEKDGFGQESLFNVMKAYSLHDREVGYCQGSGFIVGILLMQMPEEDAFAVLVRLMQDFRLRELFKPSMAELGLCMFKLECLIQELLPTLLVHFQTQNFDTSMYASSWFLTLFVTSLPLSLARRIMDLFVSEGMEMIFRVGVAILQSCQEDLLALDMEGLLKYLQKDLRNRFELESDQDNLLQTAYMIKYSHKKMKKLEKEYTALKTKENEDQIELRRLRTENRLLRQRIENLEKVEAKLLRQTEESSTLADRLVQDQVTRAQEAEEVYALRNELSVTRKQLDETQKKLMDAQEIIGDIKTRTRIIEDAVHLDESEERNMVKHLQEELIAVRLRETETAEIIKELRVKITDLEDSNLRLQRAPSNDVQQLQEELIAVKLREAEANLSLKELRMKVHEIESYWEAHMDRVRQASPREKNSKAEMRHLQEEVMSIKVKEARALAEAKECRQKVMELETQNHICTNQIRRMCEDSKELKRQLEEAEEREKDLRTNIKDLTRKLDDTESKRKEEGMMARIKEAESTTHMAELRHQVAQIDIQKEELIAAGRLQDKGKSQELENRVHDLQDEVLKLQLSMVKKPGRTIMTDSYLGNNSDEEVDAEIKDSENLNRTLSEIIEGKSPVVSARGLAESQSQPCGARSRLFPAADISEGSESNGQSASTEPSSDCVLGNGVNNCQVSGSSHLSHHQERLDGCDKSGDDKASAISPENLLPSLLGARDSSDQPNLSGETNVISDSLPGEGETVESPSTDVKGKHDRQARGDLSNVGGKSRDPRGKGKSHQSKAGPLPDNSRLLQEWELFEEVVVVEETGERLVSRNSSECDFNSEKARVIRKGHSNKGHAMASGVQKTVSRERNGGSSHWAVSDRAAKGGSSQVKHEGRQRTKIRSEENSKAKDSEESLESIPDIEIIYEPSCIGIGIRSCIDTCSREDSDQGRYVLKESSV